MSSHRHINCDFPSIQGGMTRQRAREGKETIACFVAMNPKDS